MQLSSSSLSRWSKAIAFSAATLLATSTLRGGGIELPYTEDFSDGSEGYNSSPLSASLNFNGFTYSLNGDSNGGVALFDINTFMGVSMPNFSGQGIMGDWQWTSYENPTNTKTFTIASSDSSAFALTSFDWATGEDRPMVLTFTGYLNNVQVVQLVGVDITTAGTYGEGSSAEILTTDISYDVIPGLHVVFSGAGWSNIDTFVFSTTGERDILVALDNIVYSPASVVPEPGVSALMAGAGALALGLYRRRRKA